MRPLQLPRQESRAPVRSCPLPCGPSSRAHGTSPKRRGDTIPAAPRSPHPMWFRAPNRLLLSLALLATASSAIAGGKPKSQPPSASPGGAPAAGASDKPFAEWAKLTKDAEQKKGFFTLWKKRDNLYLQIGKDPIDKARELSIPNSIVQSFKIESEDESSKAVLIDLGALLLSDVTDLTEGLKGAFNNVAVRFDKDRSTLGGIKTFPDNTELEATLTFSPLDRSHLVLEAVPDNRFIPIGVHYSFTRLPATPMPVRYADNRVGFFLDATKDFGRDDKENFWLRNIHRWRLEKKDPSAAVSEPVKPIVYYVDWTVPDKFRPWVKEGIEKWQKAFELAGFKNAILAKDPPKDDPDWDPEDVRYSTIRWITSHEPSFGAIGPSRVDPRTGEIFDSDILFEASMFQNYANAYRRFAGPEAIAKSALPEFALDGLPPGTKLDRLCMAGDALASAGALQHIALLMDGTLEPGSPVPDAFLKTAVEWAVMHEVGHALGLRHNFRSSTSTPYGELQDTGFTESHGLYSSVMEYPSPNIDYTHQKQGDWYTTTPGTYDTWAIRYGYTPSGATTADADYAFARKIADESLAPGHEYSTDEDTYPSDAPDPRSNIYDLGSDPLQFAKDRTAYLAKLWRSPGFEERIVGKSGDLTALRRAMDSMARSE